MSLLSFFANQRRHWFDQLADYPADYFAGAWAALLQAEVAFKSTPLLNAHLETQTALQRLRDADGQLHKARTQLEQARKQLGQAEPYIQTAQQGQKDANRAAQHDQRQVALTRRALVRMSAVAGRDEFDPEVRLRYLQDMISTHLALLREENPDVPSK